MYTIKKAAEITGVPGATLRAWERRYGVLAPPRSRAGYRLYDEPTIEAIRSMRALVQAGWPPSQAADEVRRHQARPTSQEHRALAVAQDRLVARLCRAGAELDTAAVHAALDEGLLAGTFEAVVDDWLMPGLAALGEDWAAGRLSVAGEHLVANAVLRRLAAAYDVAARETNAPRVLLGLPPGVLHELGLFAFAVCCRRAGLATTYLGADVPVQDWVSAVGIEQPDYVVLAAVRGEDVPALTEVVTALWRAHPGVRIGVGGAGQEEAPEAAEPLGHRIGPAADQLARVLASAQTASRPG